MGEMDRPWGTLVHLSAAIQTRVTLDFLNSTYMYSPSLIDSKEKNLQLSKTHPRATQNLYSFCINQSYFATKVVEQ